MKITERRPEVTYIVELSQVELNTITVALGDISHQTLKDITECDILDNKSFFQIWEKFRGSVR